MDYVVLNRELDMFDIAPTKEGDAGIDLRCCDSDHRLMPGETRVVSSGLKVAIPEGWVGFLLPRSGKSIKEGMALGNTVGVIDSNYRGEILIAVKNVGKDYLSIGHLERIAQLVVVPHFSYSSLKQVTELDDTNRGVSGFGDSGKI